MRQLLFGFVGVMAMHGLAFAQFEDGDGVGFARLSGNLVGAGMACGIPKDRALVLGERALFVAGRMQPSKTQVELAQIHVQAYENAYQNQRQAPRSQCKGILKAYKGIEDRLTLPQ
jgi:hypothetical protein